MASLKEGDEMVQEAALNELTELMSMSSEESLTVLPLEQLVPQLVRLHCTTCSDYTAFVCKHCYHLLVLCLHQSLGNPRGQLVSQRRLRTKVLKPNNTSCGMAGANDFAPALFSRLLC